MASSAHLNGAESDDLYFRVYKEIRARICLLDYPPGTLLSENALATEFEVSRPWLRGVLQRLEFERLLSHQAGGGFVVSTDDIKTVKEAFSLRLRLYELIADSTQNIRVSPSDLANFEKLLNELKSFTTGVDFREYGKFHMTFHEQFMKYVQNAILRDFANQLYYQTMRVWVRLLPDMPWEDELETTTAEMTETIQALKAGDLAQAALARRNQLSIFVSRLMEYMGDAMVRSSDAAVKVDRNSAG